MIAVILPDLVEARWFESLLHTQRAKLLRSMLLMKGHQRVAVISVPWYVERRRKPAVDKDADAAAITADSPAGVAPNAAVLESELAADRRHK